ncbi:phosphomannomutase [Neogemmobacter tilapiae]|uniref:Phosphomannomutase n=1 Tax=Neogemmobacter tilapiae TaxID=875041 RepID=A0A918TJ85_9RHOB|nr:phosphomannomutase [Gemmobacter tilapiae]GHC50649.1 phosphomannomutase [Gemmobacter tilapiae]
MPANRLTCFKSYDIRGRVGVDLNEDLAFRIGWAFATCQRAKTVVVGRDGRESSPALQAALMGGLCAAGVDVVDIGQAGTEEVYFAVDHFGADGGIEVTASHNPIEYNGMKLVGPGAKPLRDGELGRLESLAIGCDPTLKKGNGTIRAKMARTEYARRVVGLIDVKNLRPLRILVNAGNGVAGAAFDAIAAELAARAAPLSFVRVNHNPDPLFPNGVLNPLLPENRDQTSQAVLAAKADMGIAWDGDFDRCFFFDAAGHFVDGEHVVALLAAACLEDEPGGRIVHDRRVIWNVQSVVARAGGQAVPAKVGHVHMKHAMRQADAIYGGEMSAHHYFRDFMFCDSGMIPWLKIAALLSKTGKPLSALVDEMRANFPTSGETNFRVLNIAESVAKVSAVYRALATEIDESDGLSLSFHDWRLNLRGSSTENFLRLNIETRGNAALVALKLQEIRALLAQ